LQEHRVALQPITVLPSEIVAREDAPTPVSEDRIHPIPTAPAEPDDALILWMLSLTPTQRLEVAQGFIDSVQALRDGARP
jgi:hypothetical protein